MSPKNYRPVSLTCIICKILERILKEKILDHLLNKNLISSSQHGFLPKKSSTTNLLETIDQITEAVAFGFAEDVVYTDFAKAFDKVSHRKLLHKLGFFGLGQRIVEWIRLFLTGRSQRVVLVMRVLAGLVLKVKFHRARF